MSKKKQEQIDELTSKHNKEELIQQAEALGVDATGTKEEIATRIIEAEEANAPGSTEPTGDSEDQGEDSSDQKPKSSPSDPAADAPVVDQTKEADIRREALKKREEHIARGGDPNAPLKADGTVLKEEDEDSSAEAEQEDKD